MFGKAKKQKEFRKKPTKRLVLSAVQKQLIWGVVLLILASGATFGIWKLTNIPSLQIKDIEVIGGFTLPHSEIITEAETALSGSYFVIVPKRFEWLYPKSAIEQRILAIDKVKNVHVELQDSNTLVIAFEEHKPYALWCASRTDNACIFIDTQGYAFAKAPELTGNAFVRYIEDKVTPEVGAHQFSKEFVLLTQDFIQMMEDELGLYVTHVHKFADLDVEYTVSGGGIIKVSQSLPMQDSFSNLKAILQSDEFIHIEPGNFKYIDLRFGDKVFVNEVTDEVATTTASTTSEI